MKKRLNNNGFAIAGLLYSLLIIFLALIFSFLLMLSNRKTILDQIKKDVYNNLSGIVTDEISIDLNELPAVFIEGTDYSLPSNIINTKKSESEVSCKINDKVVTSTSSLTQGYYTVNCEIIVGDKSDTVEKEITVVSKGTSVYFNPETGKVCNQTDVVSTTGTKSGCMKWYIYSDENKNSFNLILDHNTTAHISWNSTGSNSEIKEASQQLISDTSTWDKSLNSRLITANEVAHITGADKESALKFDSVKSYGTDVDKNSAWFYLDGSGNSYSTTDGWRKRVATTKGSSKYFWLYDNTNGCTSYGCNIDDSNTDGYWIGHAVTGSSNYVWTISKAGNLTVGAANTSTSYGIRPVITVNKALFYKSKTKSEYEISANNLLKSIQNKITSQTQEGIYYFDESGDLDYNLNNIKIELNDQGIDKTKGNVSIYNNNVIYACFNYGKYNFEYNYNTKKLNSINYKCSTVRGENLVVNGDLSYGDNTNFPALTYKDSSFSISGNKNVVSDFYIPIDPNKTYELGIDMKSSNTTATYYVGFRDFDVDKKEITPDSVMYIPQTITTLSKDLNNGDTVVHLTDLSKWKNSTSSSSYKRGFIFWNYKDSTGYEYPELIYSKNIFKTLWNDSNVNKTNNTITLNSAWSKGTIKAGTKLSQATSGNVFNYSILQNKTVTTSWATYKASNINGIGKKNIDSDGNGGTVSTTFRDGSKFIKISFFIDYNKTADTTTNIKNIYFREVIS